MSDENEIKRKVELWLVAEMLEAIAGSRAVPSASEESPEPPFTFVKLTDCAEIASPVKASPRSTALPGAYEVEVKVCRVSHIDETTTAAHSAAVRQFKDALRALKDRIEQLGGAYYAPEQLVINGLDFTGTEVVTDKERQSHADIITLKAGVCG